MIRRSAFVAALLLATLPAVAMAQEQQTQQGEERWSDKGGRFGLGAAATFGAGVVDDQLDVGLGVSGVSLRYCFTDDFGLHLILGFGYSNDGGGGDQFNFGTGLYGDYRIVPFDTGKLGFLFGADFAYFDGAAPVLPGDNGFDFGAVVGLLFELWPADSLSLFLSGGLRFIFFDRNAAGAMGDENGVLFTLGTSLWGTAGFTVWL